MSSIKEKLGKPITRKQALSYIAGLSSALLTGNLGACADNKPYSQAPPLPTAPAELYGISPTPLQKKEVYQGVIEPLRGLTLIEQKELDETLSALEETKYPLLQKIAEDIRFITFSKTKPEKFPSWISENSFPFQIVRHNSEISAINIYITEERKGDSNKFIVQTKGQKSTQTEINEVAIATNLGITPQIENEPLVKGFLLAKEHLTYLLAINFAGELYNYIIANEPRIKITDFEGKPITDEGKKTRIGLTLLLKYISNQETDVWKIIDGFPMMLLVPAIISLRAKNKIPNSFVEVPGLLLANNLMVTRIQKEGTKPLEDLMKIVNAYTKDGSLLLPKNTVELALGEFAPLTLKLQSEIKKYFQKSPHPLGR